jgi:hypothetical protein
VKELQSLLRPRLELPFMLVTMRECRRWFLGGFRKCDQARAGVEAASS